MIESNVSFTAMLDAIARFLARRPRSLAPEDIASAAGNIEWRAIPAWESKTDDEIALETGLYNAVSSGRIFVATEASFSKTAAPLAADAHNLRGIVSQHLMQHGECFFNGDVVIVERDGGHIWLFHHEGQYAVIDTSKA